MAGGVSMQADLTRQIAQQMAQQMALSPLREDLQLHQGPAQKDGSPSWVIEDPMRGRFFRIGWLEFEVLQRWHLADARTVAAQVAQETLLQPSVEEVLAVRQFFAQHQLLLDKTLIDKAAASQLPQPGLATQALHRYLMFRIPLVDPDRFLQRFLPWAMPLLGQRAVWLSLAAGLLGLALAIQQWDTFASTFVDTLSWSGLLSYAVALALAKVIHELGHAFTAKKLGLRVPRMGVAIVLLLPMLYTDTGETWRLTRQRERFAIAAAGMRIELMLAAWCTLAWSFLPDGALRSAFFFLATTSWLMTLAINASPFMRFDGYYMLSDATGIPNLHDESAKVLKHALRKHLLGLQQPEPLVQGEPAPPWLLGFGLATAVYRFFLFLGIALTVYHYFFKLLGLFLFAVEIWWFILRPLVAELKVWWQARAEVSHGQGLRSATMLAVLLLVLVVPWRGQVQAEGWIRAGQEFVVYPPRAAVLDQLPRGQQVQAGDALAAMSSPDLGLRDARAQARIEALGSRLQAGQAPQASTRHLESARSTREQLHQQWVEALGANAEARQLMLAAPFAGLLVDVARDVATGQVLARQEVLARVIDPASWIAEVFVDEDDIQRIRPGASVKAYVHSLEHQVLQGKVTEIDTVPLDQLPAEMLAARHGGRLQTTDEPSALKPRRSLYRLRVQLQGQPAMQQARLAAFAIDAQRSSFADSLWRGALSALMLQASF